MLKDCIIALPLFYAGWRWYAFGAIRSAIYRNTEKFQGEQRVLDMLKSNLSDCIEKRDGMFWAIDCETTGLNAASSRIIQMAIVLFKDSRKIKDHVWYINPGVRIPPNATKVNRITNEMLNDKPGFAGVKKEISDLLHLYPLVAHNLAFDYGMIKEEFARHAMPFRPNLLFCTMRSSHDALSAQPNRRWGNREPWKKLANLAIEHDIRPSGDYHDALVDAEVCGKIYIAMKTKEILKLRQDIDRSELQLKRIAAEQKAIILPRIDDEFGWFVVVLFVSILIYSY